MTFYVENEGEAVFPFEVQELVELVAKAVLEEQECPWEVQVNVLITDGDSIRQWNRQHRGLDEETDVLSFPNLDFQAPGVFEMEEGRSADYLDPETGEVILGDIILCEERIFAQAKEYGHSIRREFAFLIAHSMYHLCGYDHVEESQAREMEELQERLLQGIGIRRE